MKTVYLLRHAKSGWDQPALDDHERSLAPRGERAAGLMGEYLAREKIEIEQILCSTAMRTRETLERVLTHIGSEPEIAYEDGLYLAAAEDLLARIRRLDDGIGTVLLLGHNPGFHELACALSGSAERSDAQRLAHKYPTAGFCELRFAADRWKNIEPGGGELLRFVTPKQLVAE